MKVLLLTVHYHPNIGGVETHLIDLVKALLKRKIGVDVLTYQPLSTKTKWEIFEDEDGYSVFRIPWLAGFFYRLVNIPALEFVYLLPGLFLLTPIFILFKKPDVIHSHGLVAGFVSAIWGKLFNKRTVVSLHSIYHFPPKGLHRVLVKWIFNNNNLVFCLSNQSAEEVKNLGIGLDRIKIFTYWIDLDIFKKVSHAKEKLGWDKKFVVLFVGRLVKEKGVLELLMSTDRFPKDVLLTIAGSGPLEGEVSKVAKLHSERIKYLGRINNDDLPKYYSGADVLIVPSIHEEGFGRIILESLACGTPVIGADRGAIPDAMNQQVGLLIDVSPENINKAIDFLNKNPYKLQQLSKNCRKFAEVRYSEKNVGIIVNSYK